MKRILTITAIIASCFAIGYGAGLLFMNMIKKNKEEKGGYIGKSAIEVVNGTLTPEVLLNLGRISDPQLSPDGTTILYGVSYTSIEKNRSCRNLMACNTDGTHERQLTRFAKSVSNARWSNDGRHIYFIQDNQLWKAAFHKNRLGKKIKLSDIPAGINEFKISPDGNAILYTSTVKNPLLRQPSDIYEDLDKAQAYETDDLMYRHWDHWVTEIPRSFVAPLNGNEITENGSIDILAGENASYELPTEPFGGVEQLDWAPDSRHIAYSCRKKAGKEYAFSTNSEIFIYDITTGSTVQVTNGGGYDTDPVWSPDGSRLAWISMERDGYEADRQRIMACSITTLPASADGQNFGMEIGKTEEITPGFQYDASGLKWTEDGLGIIFPSTIDGIGALCKANVAGHTVERLTPEDWEVSFGTPFAIFGEEGGRTRMLATCQSMNFPNTLASIESGADAEYSLIGSENEHILSKLDTIRTERIILKTAQGEDLHCWVLYPPEFNAGGKYPVIEILNGGPQTSLDASWSYRWNFRMMCQQGYVVILPNRHGDSGFGQAWKEQISGDYQGLNMEDYKLAARWAREQEWCGKIAGAGASYGGFSVYNMMGIHGDLFDCFIAHAGIFSERQMWYTTEEAWFGNWDNGGLMEYACTPGQTGPAGDGITFGGMQQAGAPYADVAKSKVHYALEPESRVTSWHTPILCIHGMMDYRIPYEQGMAAFNAAQMMGVPSRLVIFPEENHWITQPQNALLWHREFFGWLEKWIKQ